MVISYTQAGSLSVNYTVNLYLKSSPKIIIIILHPLLDLRKCLEYQEGSHHTGSSLDLITM